MTTAAVAAISQEAAKGADYFWTGATSTTWTTPGNWSLDPSGTPPSGSAPTNDLSTDVANFTGTPTTNQASASTGSTLVSGLNFQSPGWLVAVATSGTGSLTLGSAGITSTGNGTNSVSSILNIGANDSFNVDTNNTLVMGGRIQGTTVVTKTGAGTLQLNGNPNNGATVILAGFVLQTGNLAIANNFYLNQTTTNGNALTLFGGTTISSTGTGTANGTNGATVGAIVIRQTGTAAFPQTVLFDASNNGRAVISADVGLSANVGGGAKTFNIQNGTDPIDVQITGALGSFDSAGNNQTFRKTGLGTIELAHDNSLYTGAVSILEGNIIASRNNALGLGPTVKLIPDTTSDAVLDLSSPTVTTGVINDAAILTMTTGTSGAFFGRIDFGSRASPLNEIVGGLVIDGVTETPGTYSSTDFPNFLSGNGTLTVLLPEPASLALTSGVAVFGLLRRRRRPGWMGG